MVLLMVLLVSGCPLITRPGMEPYTFEMGFNEMLELDGEYNTSFHTEALDVENRFSNELIYYFDWDRTIIGMDHIKPMTHDLEAMKERIEGMESSEDEELVIKMIDTRIKMLESERLYKEGLKIGRKGDTVDGFKCGDKPLVLSLSKLWNESTIIGQEVTKEWDGFLTDYPQTRAVLGGNRPKFYDSPFWPIRKLSISNQNRIIRLCSD